MLDCIIIGTGPAGLSAAINLKTYGKDFLWLGSSGLSEKVRRPEKILNYPGFPAVTGPELLERFQAHAAAAGLTITEKTASSVINAGSYYMVLVDNEVINTRTVILCTGVMTARLLENEERLLGSGVSYCATCDGSFYRGKRIAVVCNDPKYEHEVEYLASLAAEVWYYPSFDGSEVHLPNVHVSREVPVGIQGSMRAEGILLRSGETVPVDGVFCLRNAIAPGTLVPGIPLEEGHIKVNRAMETDFPGLFAAGDCTGRPYQYTKAVGEGNVAAHTCIRYLAQQAASI